MNTKLKVTLQLGNQYCRVSTDLEPRVLDVLENALMYVDRELFYQSKTDSSINPYFSCFDKQNRTFLTGVLNRVIEVFKDLGFEVELDNKTQGKPYKGKLTRKQHPFNKLRYYQFNALNLALEAKRATIKLPTRSGKSVVIASLAKVLPGHGFITVPTKELLYQLMKDIGSWAHEVPGVIGDGIFRVGRINVGTPKSILNRIQENEKFRNYAKSANWLITDECHFTAADTYLSLSEYLTGRLYSIGFSATLYREDGKDLLLEAINGPLVYSVSSLELINHKPPFLTKPKVRMIDCPVKHTRPYLYKKNPLFKLVYSYAITDNPYRNAMVVRHALQAVELGMSPVLILVHTIDHGKKLQKLFDNEGKKVKFIFSESRERELEVREISLGKTDILISSRILTTGVNIKPLRTLIYAMGGKSRISAIQAAGRPLTLFPDKNEAWVIDYYDLDQVYVARHSEIRYQAYQEEYGDYVKRIHDDQLHLRDIFA